MAHTWWSSLCNPSGLDNNSLALPLEKALERQEGWFTLNNQTTADMWVLQVIPQSQ